MAKRTREQSRGEADPATRGRLIDAAGQVFAAKGFKAATVREIFGAGAGEALLRNCMLSVVGQCIGFFHGRRMIERLFPEQGFDPDAVDERAEQIYRFSLAALQGMRASSNASNRGRKRAY